MSLSAESKSVKISVKEPSYIEKALWEAPCIYFPCYKKQWPPRLYNCTVQAYEKCFEQNFEQTPSANMAPKFRDIEQSAKVYKTFKTEQTATILPGSTHFWTFAAKCRAQTIYFIDLYFSSEALKRVFLFASKLQQGGAPKPTATQRQVKTQDQQISEIKLLVGSCFKSIHDTTRNKGKYGDYSARREFAIRTIRKTIKGFYGNTKPEHVHVRLLRREDEELMHDRFVVFKGNPVSCFWHFGASAGAMYGKLNAYSGPWKDENDNFSNLAEELYARALEIDKDTEDGE